MVGQPVVAPEVLKGNVDARPPSTTTSNIRRFT
jgi:hypothetical protein